MHLPHQSESAGNTSNDELIKVFRAVAFAVAVRMLRDPNLADDVAQDVVIKISRELMETLDPGKAPKAFVRKMAARKAIDEIRNGKRRQNLTMNGATRNNASSPESLAMASEGNQILLNAIDELPEQQRHVFQCKYFSDMKYDEIADVLQIPSGTVGSILFAAKRNLRNNKALYALFEGSRQ